MITIKTSKTADSRTCDFSQVTKDQLIESSKQHIGDVKQGLNFFKDLIDTAGIFHDFDKLTNIDQFHSDFVTGFKKKTWWNNHLMVNRHHLQEKKGVPNDINLIDVLEMIVDCVMAGLGRTGKVYPIDISSKLLYKAFDNTIELLKKQIYVKQ